MGNLHVPDEVVMAYAVEANMDMDDAREQMRDVLRDNQPDVDADVK